MKEEDPRKRTAGAHDSATTTTTTTTTTSSQTPTAAGHILDGVPVPANDTNKSKPMFFVSQQDMVDVGEDGHLAPYGSLIKADNEYNFSVIFHQDFQQSESDTAEVRRMKAAKQKRLSDQAYRICKLNMQSQALREAREHLKICEQEALSKFADEKAKLALANAQAALLEEQQDFDADREAVRVGMVELRNFLAHPQLPAQEHEPALRQAPAQNNEQLFVPLLEETPPAVIGAGMIAFVSALFGLPAGIALLLVDHPGIGREAKMYGGVTLAIFLVMTAIIVRYAATPPRRHRPGPDV